MNIAIISGSRADAGALVAVKEALRQADVAVRWFDIPASTLGQDSRFVMACDAAHACTDTATWLVQQQFDLVILHGDRYEILGAATAAFLLGLPIAHLSGGDLTEGSQDDSIRHAITKLSHLHFATCGESAKRLTQLGEDPSRVFDVGDPGIDTLSKNLLTKTEALAAVGLSQFESYFLVSFHPNTIGDTHSDFETLLHFLLGIEDDAAIILTDPNKDSGHARIEQAYLRLESRRIRYCPGLGRRLFLSLLKHCHTFVGNSSAALYEAPTLGVKTVLVGNRQKGRKAARSDGYACERIVKIITATDPKSLLQKRFYNV